VGFQCPSTTHVPDALFDFWLTRLTGGELRVLLYATRRIFGHHAPGVDRDDIALDQFEAGVIDRSGRRVDGGSGIRSRSTLLMSLRGVVDKGLLEKTPHADGTGGHKTTTYRLAIANPRHVDRPGLSRPTTTQVPNELFDCWLPLLGDAELRALLYIIRRTLGFRRCYDQISPHHFTDGIVGRDGTVFDEGCKLSQKHLYKALNSLVAHGLISIDRHKDSRTGNVASTYALVFDDEKPRIITDHDPRETPQNNVGLPRRAPTSKGERKGQIGGAITTDRPNIEGMDGERKGQRGGAIATQSESDKDRLPYVSQSNPRSTVSKGKQQIYPQQRDEQQQHDARVACDHVNARVHGAAAAPESIDMICDSTGHEGHEGHEGHDTALAPPMRAARAALALWGITAPGLLRELAADPTEVLAQVARLDDECARGGIKNPAGWLIASIRERYRIVRQDGAMNSDAPHPTTTDAGTSTERVARSVEVPAQMDTSPPNAMIVDDLAKQIWAEVCADLRLILTSDNYNHWFAPVVPHGLENGTLIIAVPNDFHAHWLNDRLRSKIDAARMRVSPDTDIRFVVQTPLTQEGRAPSVALSRDQARTGS